MDREQMHSLIEQVAAEVDRRLARRNGGQGRSSAHIVLLPAPAAFPEELGRCLGERYGGWIMAARCKTRCRRSNWNAGACSR